MVPPAPENGNMEGLRISGAVCRVQRGIPGVAPTAEAGFDRVVSECGSDNGFQASEKIAADGLTTQKKRLGAPTWCFGAFFDAEKGKTWSGPRKKFYILVS